MKKPNPLLVLATALVLAAVTGPASALAYGEADTTYRSSPIAGTFCTGSITLLGDQGALVWMNGNRLARLRGDGTLDTSWGNGGLAVLPDGIASFSVSVGLAVRRTADGGFLVAGNSSAGKLQAGGALDPAYGTSGHSDPYGGSFADSPAIQADGGLVSLSMNEQNTWTWRRIGPDGRLDASFGTGGAVRIPRTNATVYAWGVQADGSIQYATAGRQPDGVFGAVLHRFPVDFAPSDGAQGRLMPRDVVVAWTMPGARVDGQGRLVVALRENSPEGMRLAVARFDAQGRPDATFGTAGVVVTAPIGGTTLSANLINFEPDGAITVVARPEIFLPRGGRAYRQYLYRFSDAGVAVASFPNGLQISDYDGVAMDDAGRLLVNANEAGGCVVKRLAGDNGRSEATLVEYQYRDRYFMTAEGFESALLDGIPGTDTWRRTGRLLGGWLPAAQVSGSLPTCRFYGDLAAGPVGHVYSLQGAECDLLRADDIRRPSGTRAWRFEGLAFNEAPVSATGACPPSLQPVYRVYNDAARRGGDPNHRFATDPALVAEMQAKGWILEGVAFCAPLPAR